MCTGLSENVENLTWLSFAWGKLSPTKFAKRKPDTGGVGLYGFFEPWGYLVVVGTTCLSP